MGKGNRDARMFLEVRTVILPTRTLLFHFFLFLFQIKMEMKEDKEGFEIWGSYVELLVGECYDE